MNDKEKLSELLNPWLAHLSLCAADDLIAKGVTIPVRCKDCKHLIVANREELYAYCPRMNTCFVPFGLDTREHFCSKGERKTENDTKCVDSITPQTKKALETMGKTAHGEIDFDYEAED